MQLALAWLWQHSGWRHRLAWQRQRHREYGVMQQHQHQRNEKAAWRRSAGGIGGVSMAAWRQAACARSGGYGGLAAYSAARQRGVWRKESGMKAENENAGGSLKAA